MLSGQDKILGVVAAAALGAASYVSGASAQSTKENKGKVVGGVLGVQYSDKKKRDSVVVWGYIFAIVLGSLALLVVLGLYKGGPLLSLSAVGGDGGGSSDAVGGFWSPVSGGKWY